MTEKTFAGDLAVLYAKLNAGHPFSLGRYGDGEMGILFDRNAGNREFQYNQSDTLFFGQMWEAFRYEHPNHYVGLACPCCVGDEKHESMVRASGQRPDHLTWSNIFVNANYAIFEEHWIPSFRDHEIWLVCNESASLARLPFEVNKCWRVGHSAWKDGDETTMAICKALQESDAAGVVVLICAGPFGSTLVHQLQKANDRNFYLDVGSVFDIYFYGRATRGYLHGGSTLNKFCIWGDGAPLI